MLSEKKKHKTKQYENHCNLLMFYLLTIDGCPAVTGGKVFFYQLFFGKATVCYFHWKNIMYVSWLGNLIGLALNKLFFKSGTYLAFTKLICLEHQVSLLFSSCCRFLWHRSCILWIECQWSTSQATNGKCWLLTWNNSYDTLWERRNTGQHESDDCDYPAPPCTKRGGTESYPTAPSSPGWWF